MEVKESAFRFSFEILKFFGVYQPVSTKWTIRRAILFLSFVVLNFLVASIYRILFVTNFNEFICALTYVIFSVNLTFKLFNFKTNQNEILKLIEDLERMDKELKENCVRNWTKRILLFMSILVSTEVILGLVLSFSIILLSNEKIFTIPQIYHPDNNYAYGVVFVLHLLQIIGIGTISQGNNLKKYVIFFNFP